MKNIFNQIITLFVLAALTLSACAPEEKTQEKAQENKARPIKTHILTMDSIQRTINYTANVIAFEELYYAPAQPGRISAIYVEVGDRVQKGQELVKMEQTQLTQSLLQVEEARRNFMRMDTLYNLNSIPKQQYDQAKTQYEIALSNLEYLQDNTVLTAPFSGVVTGKYYETGELYSGAPNTQAGKAAVIALMQISKVKAVVSISEQYFAEIKKGMTAELTTDNYPGRVFDGRIYKLHPTIDAATRTFKVEILIDNKKELLRPGMYAKVAIHLKSELALLVPAIAVVKEDGTNNRYVFIHENGIARKVSVEVGMRKNDRIEVISDKIKPGVELVVAGQSKLMNGDEVEVKN
ncbi:MAG: efflux RND transporter periplasmic adaptor subunit [Salinivirgaceae bacterium]|jgi:membrane fusion protein (multidrug efflux system)|nr:efflux RND transporter periplasmic adaptor subunit [Salinivirgaceae bacterium]